MKKLFLVIVLSFTLFSTCFSLTWVEKLLLPEFHGDIATVPHRVVEETDTSSVIEIDGVLYIIKN